MEVLEYLLEDLHVPLVVRVPQDGNPLGKLTSAADALSRAYCARVQVNALYNIHASLCHPATRLYLYVLSKNLPLSVFDVRKIVQENSVRAEIQPNLIQAANSQLLKATQPFNDLSLDSEGPLQSSTKNHTLIIVEEY